MDFPLDCRERSTFWKLSELQQCQAVMTRMLHVFDIICRKHEIIYSCMYGTLLGAVRHGGFIPWDGDVDVAVREEDLPRLKAALISDMPREMFYQDMETDPLFDSTLIIKIRDRYSNYVEWRNSHQHQKYHNGLQIDLFPFRLQNDGIHRWNQFENETYLDADLFNPPGQPANALLFQGHYVHVPPAFMKLLLCSYGNLDEPPLRKQFPHEGKASPITPCDHKESLVWKK